MGCGGSAPVQDAYESPPTAATQKSAPSPAAPAAAAAPAADESPRGILWASGQYGKERRNSDASVARGGIKFGETPSNGISIIQGVPVMKARLVEASEEMDGPGGPGVMSNGNPRLVKLTLTAIEAAPEAAEPAAAADDAAAAPAPAPAAETAPPADEKPRPSEIKRKDLTAGLLDELMGEAVETEAARNSETG